MNDRTMTFSIGDQTEQEIRNILTLVYDALKEKGYNPINQIVGYILSEDPTYITTHNNARNLIRKIDRDTLLQSLVKYYLYEKAALHSPFSANYQRCIHLFYAYRQRCLYGCSCRVYLYSSNIPYHFGNTQYRGYRAVKRGNRLAQSKAQRA